MGTSAAPMLVDNVLDKRNIFFGNSAFSDGYGQHDDCISERYFGRQLKMQGNENIFSGEFLPGNSTGGVGH